MEKAIVSTEKETSEATDLAVVDILYIKDTSSSLLAWVMYSHRLTFSCLVSLCYFLLLFIVSGQLEGLGCSTQFCVESTQPLGYSETLDHEESIVSNLSTLEFHPIISGRDLRVHG